MNLEALKAPFAPEKISWRVGSTTRDKSKGMALAYIDARDVQDRLDEACGTENWQCRYPHANGKTVCEIGVRFGDEWIWKADGAGDSDIEAEKGALSDAFKRAAVRWGVGRYLYDLESPWVKLDGNRIDADEYPRLRALLAGKAATAAPKPTEQPRRQTLGEWAENAPAAIAALRSDKEMSGWLQANSAVIDMLHDKNKPVYNTISNLIATKNDELRRIAA